MDSALLKEREAFNKKALSIPIVENRRKKDTSISDVPRKKIIPSTGNLDLFSYKSMTGSSQYKFGVLAKVVKHMRKRHQEGLVHPLTLDEILDETNQLDVGSKVKQWLSEEALKNNLKIEETLDGRFLFKPPYKLKDRKSLLRLLKQHDLKGMGGVLLEDIQESLPHADKALKVITRVMDKKLIVFYNDRSCQFTVDEEFQKQWRAVAVDSIDDEKIDEYLQKQGIRSMQDHGLNQKIPFSKRKKSMQKKRMQKRTRDNEHLGDLLQNYEESESS